MTACGLHRLQYRAGEDSWDADDYPDITDEHDAASALEAAVEAGRQAGDSSVLMSVTQAGTEVQARSRRLSRVYIRSVSVTVVA